MSAGHDIDYIAIAGALWPIGRGGEAPVPPLNLVGDFGGGGMLLAFGMSAALVDAQPFGRGPGRRCRDGRRRCVAHEHDLPFKELGLWTDERGSNTLDSGRTSTRSTRHLMGKWSAVERSRRSSTPKLLELLGLDAGELPQGERQVCLAGDEEAFCRDLQDKVP